MGIKDPGGKERRSLGLPTLRTLCTEVSAFLSGLFYKGLLTSSVWAPFLPPSSVGHWLELPLSRSDSQGGGISMAAHRD